MLERGIEVGHQLTDAINRQFVCRDHHAVGALVGHQHRLFVCVGALTLPGLLQGVQHADHVLGDPVLEADNLGGLDRRAVHALDNVDDATDVGSNVGNDDGVTRCIGRHVRLLWHQRTKHRNQFGRRDIVESNDLGHVFIVSHRALVVHDRHRGGTGIFAGHNADHLSAAHRRIALHIENG